MRAWLDTAEEVVGQYPQFRRPTRVERYIGDYFEQWLEEAKVDMDRRHKSTREVPIDEETRAFHGFETGDNDEATWEQWIDFVIQLDEPEEARR